MVAVMNQQIQVDNSIMNEPQIPVEMPKLTKLQERTLSMIGTYYFENRYMPTQREIVNALGRKSNTAAPWVQPLIDKGYLKKKLGGRRGLSLTELGIIKLDLMGDPISGQQLVLKM